MPAPGRQDGARARERGGIVTGWLFKLLLSLAVVGVVAFEAGAVIVSRVSIDGIAGEAAGEAAIVYGRGQDLEAAEQAAREYVRDHGATLVSVALSQDSTYITVTAVKEARTIVLHRIGATKSWTESRATGRRRIA